MEKPLRVLCGREIQNTIHDSVKRLLDDVIKEYDFDNFFTSTRTEIRGVNGSNFIFSGLQHNPAKIKSMEGIDIAWLEEADSISQETLDLLIPTIRKENSEIWFSFNRRDINAPVDKMFIGQGRPDSFIYKINYDQNPWFPGVLRKEMEYDKAHDPGKYQHVWLGEPVKHSEALVFYGKWQIDDTIFPAENETLYYGADWGFSTDPAVLVRMWCDHKKRILYIDQEAYGVGVEIDDLPAFFDTVTDSRRWIITADSQRPDTISYMRRHGFRIRGAIKGKGSIVEGVEFLRSYTVVVHSRCKNVIYELGAYSYKVDKLTKDVLPLLEDKNNHCIDSIRYALEKITRKKEVKDLLKRD